MLTDDKITKLASVAIGHFTSLEVDLLEWIAKRFSLYNTIGGDLEYKLIKLAELGGLDREAIEMIASSSSATFAEVENAIKQAGIQSINYATYRKAYQLGATLSRVDDIMFTDVVSSIYTSTTGELNLIYQEISKQVPKAYRNVLDKINLETTLGIYDYNTSYKKALSELAEKGITGMTYQRTVKDENGREVKVPVNYSIEGVARRTIVSAIVRSGNAHNEKVAIELGAEWYATSQHIGARNKGIGHMNHESWQGKHFQIANNEFARMTGEGEVDGLGGVNCRHIKFAYFPNISPEMEEKINTEENARVYELKQKQRRYERLVRIAKKQLKMAEATGDTDYIDISKENLAKRQSNLRKYVNEHKELRRDYTREKIQ